MTECRTATQPEMIHSAFKQQASSDYRLITSIVLYSRQWAALWTDKKIVIGNRDIYVMGMELFSRIV